MSNQILDTEDWADNENSNPTLIFGVIRCVVVLYFFYVLFRHSQNFGTGEQTLVISNLSGIIILIGLPLTLIVANYQKNQGKYELRGTQLIKSSFQRFSSIFLSVVLILCMLFDLINLPLADYICFVCKSYLEVVIFVPLLGVILYRDVLQIPRKINSGGR